LSIPTEKADVDFWDFAVPIIVVFGHNALLFFWCQKKEDNSYIDVFWGLTMLFPILALFLKKYIDGTYPDARSWLMLIMVGIWSIRLAWHIGARHTKEDFRYVDMRNRWMQNGQFGYYWRAFLYVFMLQGLFSLIVNSAALYTVIYSENNILTWLDMVGVVIWTIGFAIEWVGDEQLKRHLADKTPGKQKFIAWGLWRYTRHPNYFGEAMLWWGVYLVACTVQTGWVTIYAPLWITILVRFISGVPLLERKYADRADWQKYCRETNVFVPWFYKK